MQTYNIDMQVGGRGLHVVRVLEMVPFFAITGTKHFGQFVKTFPKCAAFTTTQVAALLQKTPHP